MGTRVLAWMLQPLLTIVLLHLQRHISNRSSLLNVGYVIPIEQFSTSSLMEIPHRHPERRTLGSG